MNKETNPTELQHYLLYLKTYLCGDLDSFHEVCDKCEENERKENISPDGATPITSNMSKGSMWGRGSTTIDVATKAPEFNEGVAGIPKYFRSTIPHSLTLFATIDTLGYLIREGEDYFKTSKNFRAFFKKAGIHPLEGNVLLKVYRHGMSHSYFPKLGVAISFHSSNQGKPLFFKLGATIILNVNALETIVIKQLEEIRASLNSFPKIGKQFNQMIKAYLYESADDLKRLEKRL